MPNEISVTVPEGFKAGTAISVGEGDAAVQVTIPDGAQAGDTFSIAVPTPPASPPDEGGDRIQAWRDNVDPNPKTCCGKQEPDVPGWCIPVFGWLFP
jgi:hypothetical protein